MKNIYDLLTKYCNGYTQQEQRQFLDKHQDFSAQLDYDLWAAVGLTNGQMKEHYQDLFWFVDDMIMGKTTQQIIDGINFDLPCFDYLFD